MNGTNAHGPHSCCTAFSLLACADGFLGKMAEEEKTWFCFTDGYAQMVGSYSLKTLLWDTPEGQRGTDILLVGRNSGSTSDCVLFAQKRDDQTCNYILIHEL